MCGIAGIVSLDHSAESFKTHTATRVRLNHKAKKFYSRHFVRQTKLNGLSE
jgi:hypothetical protein